jgi:hypothetical protein
MNSFKSLSRNSLQGLLKLFVCLFAFVLLFGACTKPVKSEGGPATYASFFNAVPKSTDVDFFINNQLVNPKPITFGSGLEYFNVLSGSAKLDLTYGNVQVVASGNTTFDDGKYYSVFAAGKAPVEFIVTEDNRATPPLGKAKLRFVQLSPDAPNIDVDIERTPNLFTDLRYKSATDYINVDPDSYTVKIRQTGMNTVKFSELDVSITEGANTVVLLGLWNGTSPEPPLDIKLIKDK